MRGSLPRNPAATAAILAAAAAVLAGACVVDRDRPSGPGYHEAGWAEKSSPAFHAKWLKAHKDQLGDCRRCHGEDYSGGAAGTSCNGASCHTAANGGPEFCGTCHGSEKGPLPDTGAHAKHAVFCNDCHDVPKNAHSPKHPDGTIELAFSGLAAAGPTPPSWNDTTERCANTYCHGAESPQWTGPKEIGCDGCHGNPPDSHVRWSRVAKPGSCKDCHDVPPDPRHLDGHVDKPASLPCNTCHGTDATGAPPLALDGSTDPTSPAVGAHERHLNEALADRIGKVAECNDCHVVPASVLADGHLDTSAPADVRLWNGGTFDPAGPTCVVGCHWDRTGADAPNWTDNTGKFRACTACHGFPPAVTRKGTAHPSVPPDQASLEFCEKCHSFSPLTHVDGHVDFNQATFVEKLP